MIRLIFSIIFLIIAYTFLISNSNETVNIHYFLGIEFKSIPLYIIISGSFLIGLSLSAIIILPEWIRLKIDLRKKKRIMATMEEDLNKFRMSINQGEKGYKGSNVRPNSFDEAI